MSQLQKCLQLHSMLSKIIDSLCFQMCVNKKDQNSTSLLEILTWRRKGDIDEQQFIELYRSWLESKSIFDIFTCRQVQVYPKHQFIGLGHVEKEFMVVGNINKALEQLNIAYNRLYREKKPANIGLIDQAEEIFSHLDEPGYIHLRLSSLFFLTGATIILERYSVPLNYEAFRVHMNDLRREMCEIGGIVSLRGFKNYMLNLNSVKRTNYLNNLMGVFAEIQNFIGTGNKLPNLLDQAFGKWRNFPRFASSQNKRNLENYKRVFEENEQIFFDDGATLEYFLQKYGEQFVKCYQIDASLLREFNVLMKQSFQKYIELFTRVSQKMSTQKQRQSSLISTHRKKQPSDQYPQTKLTNKSSLRDKTPTKSQRTIQYKNTRTPTKISNYDNHIRREFGSADKSKSKNYRQTTPTKSFRNTATNQNVQANTTSRNAIKIGIEKDSFYNKMLFFRNKRVESYEIVMKRLKNQK